MKHLQFSDPCLPHSRGDGFYSCLDTDEELGEVTRGVRDFLLLGQCKASQRHTVGIDRRAAGRHFGGWSWCCEFLKESRSRARWRVSGVPQELSRFRGDLFPRLASPVATSTTTTCSRWNFSLPVITFEYCTGILLFTDATCLFVAPNNGTSLGYVLYMNMLM